MKTNEDLIRELATTQIELERIKKYSNEYKRNWVLHRPSIFLKNDIETSSVDFEINDEELLKRIGQAYRSACDTEFGSNWWITVFGPRKEPIHRALFSGNLKAIQEHFRNPASNLFFLGFDTLTNERPSVGDDWYKFESAWIYDNLLMLLEALGEVRHLHPESYTDNSPTNISPVDELLEQLDKSLGAYIPFPNPYPGEIGLKSSRGVISYRSIQAIYQAWRIKMLLANSPTKKVIEIGGGLGRTAFYSSILGVNDYSIVDIPMTSAAQAYFLGRTLGENKISLYKESGQTHQIKILPPECFFESSDEVDLIVNIDSFPEIEEEVVKKYLNWSMRRAHLLLSINHETLSSFTVRGFALQAGAISKLRYPYWLRRGYVEELYQLKEEYGFFKNAFKLLGLYR